MVRRIARGSVKNWWMAEDTGNKEDVEKCVESVGNGGGV